MPSFRKILATTALCLAAVGLSSCISRMHRVAYEYPRTYEGVGIEDNSVSTGGDAGSMKLTKRLYVYECDGQWYLPVSRICYTKKVIQGEPDTSQAYQIANVSREDKRQYYLPISSEFAGKLRTASRIRRRQNELTDYITQPKLLTSLPQQAKAYPILMPIADGKNGDLLVQTDTHVGPSAILAYPVAAVLFVVDIPVTVVSSTVAFIGVGTYVLVTGRIGC
ncbi:MAG: hypothetical protein IKT79_03300 [Akkermansia sp.]|nr:hypothetical protein [Akkermansia sp.]